MGKKSVSMFFSEFEDSKKIAILGVFRVYAGKPLKKLAWYADMLFKINRTGKVRRVDQ